MIDIDLQNISDPISKFNTLYNKALSSNQGHIEAANISTINEYDGYPDSRFVNIKCIKNNKFIFFSNYASSKGRDLKANNKSSATFFWDTINTQIRIKGKITKTSKVISDTHFNSRSFDKNILAISSNQSKTIMSYSDVKRQYMKVYDKLEGQILKRPAYWGGYELNPFYFEFWEGDDSRINKRKAFTLVDQIWESSYLEP